MTTIANGSSGLIEVLVRKKVREADQVFSFVLVREDGAPFPPFEAGSHVDVHLPDGTVRQYSLCERQDDLSTYMIAVLREDPSRGGSRQLADDIAQGSRLRISVPRNLFALDAAAADSLLIAGGIGITPIMAMAESLNRQGRSFQLHYTCRTRARMAFGSALVERFGTQVTLHCDDEPSALDLKAIIGSPREGVHLYVCGPAGLIDAALSRARELGWEESTLHVERFQVQQEVHDGDSAFEVELASTGQRIVVARDQTVIDALEESGLELEFSCSMGICGTCVTKVLSGVPDHRDHFLTPEEHACNDRFTPCCSRSLTPLLVIDL